MVECEWSKNVSLLANQNGALLRYTGRSIISISAAHKPLVRMKATKSTDRMKQALRNLREQIRIERLDVVGLESVRNSVRKERANYPMPIAGYIERVQRDGIDVWCRESILEWIFKVRASL